MQVLRWVFGTLGLFATGCSPSYDVMVRCKDPLEVTTATEYGKVNLAGHTFGRAFRRNAAGELVHVDDLRPSDGIVPSPIGDKITVSLEKSFEITASADVPETVKAEVTTALKGNLKLVLEDAVRHTAPGDDYLTWVNNTQDGTLGRLQNKMGGPGQLQVVNQLITAKSMRLTYGNEALANISVKVIQVVNAEVRAHFQCSNIVDMAGAAPFYGVQTFEFDGTKFTTAR